MTRNILPGRLPALLLTVFFVSGVGCGDSAESNQPAKRDFGIDVELKTPDGESISGAPVVLDGKTVGYTDRNGVFRATLRERPGRTVELKLGELDGYEYLKAPVVTEPLELAEDGSGDQPEGVPVELRATAKSTAVRSLVWMRARCAEDSLDRDDCKGLEVVRDGETVSVTDRTGLAHFVVEGTPGTEVVLTLDTPDDGSEEAPSVAPSDPQFTVELALRPRIYLVEQRLRGSSLGEDDRSRTPSARPPSNPQDETSRSASSNTENARTTSSPRGEDTTDKNNATGSSSSDDGADPGWDDFEPVGESQASDSTDDDNEPNGRSPSSDSPEEDFEPVGGPPPNDSPEDDEPDESSQSNESTENEPNDDPPDENGDGSIELF